MKIITVFFDYDIRNRYEKLARVLAHSAKMYCPNASFELIKLPKPTVKTYKRSFESNTIKINEWLRVLKNTKENCIFMDADMVILRNISDIFDDKTFDVAYTIRDGKYRTNLPMNGGFVAIRNNKAGKEFLELWVKANSKMYKDIVENHGRKLHNKWRSKYGGMNQAAFGYLISKKNYTARLKSLLCSEWNSCIEHWQNINSFTRVIHIKSSLRNAILGNRPTELMAIKMRKAVALWRRVAADLGENVPDNGENVLQHKLKKKKKKVFVTHRMPANKLHSWV